MKASSKITDADRELFYQATRLVKPMRKTNIKNIFAQKKHANSVLLARRANAEGANNDASGLQAIENSNTGAFFDELATEYMQIGYGTDLVRDLKRGKWPVQANLDLHGYTLEDAIIHIDRFISACLDNNIRCIRVIHGKGIGSRDGKPVLKTFVRHHLSRLKSVQAWVQAKERDGGSGAILVLIRHKK